MGYVVILSMFTYKNNAKPKYEISSENMVQWAMKKESKLPVNSFTVPQNVYIQEIFSLSIVPKLDWSMPILYC